MSSEDIDQLQAQEPMDRLPPQWPGSSPEWEDFRNEVYQAILHQDPSELGSISTTDGLEQQAELDPESNPELPFE